MLRQTDQPIKTKKNAPRPEPGQQVTQRHRSARSTNHLYRTARNPAPPNRTAPSDFGGRPPGLLRGGEPYAAIIKKLAEKGHELNSDIVSRWHGGGYQDWLKEQAWWDDARARLDFATEVVHADNVNLLT